MKVLKNKWFIAVLVVVLIGVVVGFDLNRTPAPKYFTAHAQQGTINDVVQATGTINAVTLCRSAHRFPAPSPSFLLISTRG